MSNNRIKMTAPPKVSRDQAETLMNELAQAANDRRKFAAERDQAVLAINERFEGIFAAIDAAMKMKSGLLRAWAEASPEEFPVRNNKPVKSIELLSGTLGFRTGMPKLAPLNRGWTWEKITQAVCELLPAFVRSKPEVDKEAILGQREEEAIKMILPHVGLKVVQDESFFVEPKLTENAARLVQVA